MVCGDTSSILDASDTPTSLSSARTPICLVWDGVSGSSATSAMIDAKVSDFIFCVSSVDVKSSWLAAYGAPQRPGLRSGEWQEEKVGRETSCATLGCRRTQHRGLRRMGSLWRPRSQGGRREGKTNRKTSLDAPSPTCETMPAYLLMLSASCAMANSMRRETMCSEV